MATKKIKRLTFLQKVQAELKAEKEKSAKLEEYAGEKEELAEDRRLNLERIREALGFSSQQPVSKVLVEINNLQHYKKQHEGSLNIAFSEAERSNRQLVEIIRWHVNPASAIPTKCIDERQSQRYCTVPGCDYCRRNGRGY